MLAHLKRSNNKLLSNVLVLSQSELVCYVFTVARRYVYVCMMYDLIKWHHQMEIYQRGVTWSHSSPIRTPKDLLSIHQLCCQTIEAIVLILKTKVYLYPHVVWIQLKEKHIVCQIFSGRARWGCLHTADEWEPCREILAIELRFPCILFYYSAAGNLNRITELVSQFEFHYLFFPKALLVLLKF